MHIFPFKKSKHAIVIPLERFSSLTTTPKRYWRKAPRIIARNGCSSRYTRCIHQRTRPPFVCKYTFTQNGVRGRPTSVFSERHGRWSSPDISIRVACAVTVARLLRPRSSGERVNWFTEKTISALAYRILSTPRLTRNNGASAGRHTEQRFKFIVPTDF